MITREAKVYENELISRSDRLREWAKFNAIRAGTTSCNSLSGTSHTSSRGSQRKALDARAEVGRTALRTFAAEDK